MAYEQYIAIGILIVFSTILALIVVFASRILGPRRPSPKKLVPYESGMTPIGPAMRRLPIKFYLVAVLFILFDVEVIFLLPYAVIVRRLGLYGLIAAGVFVVILTIGLLYEWKKGALEWE
ncbi:MAG TPA: NADH-quinone oxidoreductase subunit A [Chloroflexi bacterium]|nr:NADH-quinone oxidoreductase subunit A [Chloroflexota bacterium]